jgi:hypothetical protein
MRWPSTEGQIDLPAALPYPLTMTLGKCALAAIVFATGVGCGGNGNPSFDDVSHQFYKAYCSRLRECMIELTSDADADAGIFSFQTAYPGGEQDCVDQNFKEFSSLSTLESTCDQQKWDQCSKDIKDPTIAKCVRSATTPAIGLKIPESCKGC